MPCSGMVQNIASFPQGTVAVFANPDPLLKPSKGYDHDVDELIAKLWQPGS